MCIRDRCSMNQQEHVIMSSRSRHGNREHGRIRFAAFCERLSVKHCTNSLIITGELNEFILPNLILEFPQDIKDLPTPSTRKFDKSVWPD